MQAYFNSAIAFVPIYREWSSQNLADGALVRWLVWQALISHGTWYNIEKCEAFFQQQIRIPTLPTKPATAVDVPPWVDGAAMGGHTLLGLILGGKTRGF